MRHADALLAATRLRLPKAFAAPLAVDSERAGDRFSPAFLRLARALVDARCRLPAGAQEHGLREEVCKGLRAMLEQARRKHQAPGAPRNELVVRLNPYEAPSPDELELSDGWRFEPPTGGPPPSEWLTLRIYQGGAHDVGAVLQHLEEEHPGARRALLAALNAASYDLPIVTPWNLWELFADHVWAGYETTAEFVEHMMSFNDPQEDDRDVSNMAPEELAEKMGWITPGDYRAAVHSDYIPPWAPAEDLPKSADLFPRRRRRRETYPETPRERLHRMAEEAATPSARRIFTKAAEMLTWKDKRNRPARSQVDSTLSIEANLFLVHFDGPDTVNSGLVRGMIDDVFQQQAEYSGFATAITVRLPLPSKAAGYAAIKALQRWFDRYALLEAFLNDLADEAALLPQPTNGY
jgi:hypothetical protein